MNKIDIKRAFLCGALGWALIFFEVSILMFGLNLGGMSYYFAHYTFAALIMAIVSVLYFKGKKSGEGLETGLVAGGIFVLSGIILDSIITIPLFIKSYDFFLDWKLWIGFIEGIAISAVVGVAKEHKVF